MIEEFSRTHQRETSEVQPEERLQREVAQANRQDNFERLQAEEEQMQAFTGGVLPDPKESVSLMTFHREMGNQHLQKSIQAFKDNLIDEANKHISLVHQHYQIADQLEVEKGAGKRPISESSPSPKPRGETGESSQSRSPEHVERGQSDASHESPGMRDVLRNHDAFSTVASPETSGLASQGATPLERSELKRPEVKEKRKKDNKFVKVLEKIVDCVSCNGGKLPPIEPDEEYMRSESGRDLLSRTEARDVWKQAHPSPEQKASPTWEIRGQNVYGKTVAVKYPWSPRPTTEQQ